MEAIEKEADSEIPSPLAVPAVSDFEEAGAESYGISVS